MTLILAATCCDGIAVCSDKRRKCTTAERITYTDDLCKIYRFSTVDVLAYNHGINRILDRYWDRYLEDFEAAHAHVGMGFGDLVKQFKAFIGGSVLEELAGNRFADAVGFVFCAPQPAVRELFWKKDQPLIDRCHCGLVRSGDGARYLVEYLSGHPELNTVEHWSRLTIEAGLSGLIDLFGEARAERQRQGGQEFSDAYDTAILRRR